MGRKRRIESLGPWVMDSGGYTELTMYGKWTVSEDRYIEEIELLRDGNLDWIAPQDWMCEPWVIEKTGLTTEKHQHLTCLNYLRLMDKAPHLPFIPVLQGWTQEEYEQHAVLYQHYGVDLRSLPTVGIGSVCRRHQIKAGREVVEMFAQEGYPLHAFGMKTTTLIGIAPLLQSSDSMAWSQHARWIYLLEKRKMVESCEHKSCQNCMAWALEWREQLVRSIEEASGMTEGNAKLADPRIVVTNADGRVESKRFHLFRDCSFIKDEKEVTELGERETKLLGLKVCSVCERRKTGGPVIEALKAALRLRDDLASPDVIEDAAWNLLNDLKAQGFYIAQRGARSATRES